MTDQTTNASHPSKDKNCPNKQPQLLLQGIDSLYCGFFTDGIGIDWEDLSYRKELIRADGKEFAKVTIGNTDFALMPHGEFPYRYILRTKDMIVKLAEQMQPNIHVQFLSEALWFTGPQELIMNLRNWIVSVGMTETCKPTVSRIDWAFDFELPEVDFETSQFMSRAQKDMTFRGLEKLETVSFGKDETVIRVYNKSLEIEEKSGKVWFHDLWGLNDNVWRVEVQMRRGRLKRFNIITVEDILDHQGDAVMWAFANHTTLRCPSSDSNKSRWPLHPLWDAVQAAAQTMPAQGVIDVGRHIGDADYKKDQLRKSVRGMARALAASELSVNPDRPIPTPEEIMAELSNFVTRTSTKGTWDDEILARVAKMEFGL